jgi:hypothetical protein
MQSFVAYLILSIALLYAIWLFCPQVARRWLLVHLVQCLPSSQRERFARLPADVGGSGCSTCKGCASEAAPSSIKVIELHRR